MKYIRVLIISISVLFITGCNKTIVDELPKDYYLELNDSVVDVYSDSKLSDIIDKTNISYMDDKLDTESIGETI